MNRLIIFSFVLALLLTSCEPKEPDDPPVQPPPSTGLTPAMARDSLYYLMKQWYYWYDVMPVVNKENYSDPYQLMEAMRYKPLDRWSFVADYDEFLAEMSGTFVGHGIRIGIDESKKARIAMIYSLSPLYAEGVRRGWIIKTINNVDIAAVIIAGDAEAYNNALGPAEAGVTNTFVFQKPDGSEVTINSTKKSFQVNSVLLYDTLHLSSGITGHLVFESFIEPSAQELETAFSFFKENNIKDLILDLRYNSGGYLYVARKLASYIAGNTPAASNTTFARLTYNNKNAAYNTNYPFETTSYPIGLTRIVFITSNLTASASEAVINGLKPLMNVVTVGDTTHGKPVGMNGWEVGEKYFFWPVTFKMVNKDNEGDFFEGFAPSKFQIDDITHDFDDRREYCLKEAISYLTTGSFSATKGITVIRPYPQVSEKPEWMNNAFATEKIK